MLAGRVYPKSAVVMLSLEVTVTLRDAPPNVLTAPAGRSGVSTVTVYDPGVRPGERVAARAVGGDGQPARVGRARDRDVDRREAGLAAVDDGVAVEVVEHEVADRRRLRESEVHRVVGLARRDRHRLRETTRVVGKAPAGSPPVTVTV